MGHRFYARDSVDERLVEILRAKRELFDAFARESRLEEAREIVELERARLAQSSLIRKSTGLSEKVVGLVPASSV